MASERETRHVRVAVVGAGPAGTSTALHLVKAEGIDPSDIVVFDKARHPREKPCAGAVSAWGLRILAGIDVPITVPHVPMAGLRILDGPRTGKLEGTPLGVVVRRSEFDADLVRRARATGVPVFDGEAVVDIRRHGRSFVVRTKERTVLADRLAACDGTGSVVRKAFDLREPARKGHLYVLETAELPGDVGTRAGLCDFDLGPADGPLEGYVWDFPTVIDGARRVSRGIYHANRKPLADVKAILERSLRDRDVDPGSVRFKPFSTRPFVRGTTLTLPGVVFVGEAAGIDRATGEGIAQALEFGAFAARALSDSLRRNSDDLRAYADRVHGSTLGRHLRESATLTSLVYGRRGTPFRRLLAGSDRARRAGVRWYVGESLGLADKFALGVELVRQSLSAAAYETSSMPGASLP